MIDLKTFAEAIKIMLQDHMPLESEINFLAKHKNRDGRMRDIALGSNNVFTLPNGNQVFELGNEKAEKEYPYYHILEDAQVISKRDMGTKRTKGSQDEIKELSKRDYGIVKISKSGNTYQEYRKNVRGKRSLVGKSTRAISDYKGDIIYINRESKYYENIHYHYIEKILDRNVEYLAKDFGLIAKKRVEIDNEYSVFDQIDMGD